MQLSLPSWALSSSCPTPKCPSICGGTVLVSLRPNIRQMLTPRQREPEACEKRLSKSALHLLEPFAAKIFLLPIRLHYMYLNIYRIGCLQPFFIPFMAILKLPMFYLKCSTITQATIDLGFYLLMIFPLFSFGLQLHFNIVWKRLPTSWRAEAKKLKKKCITSAL